MNRSDIIRAVHALDVARAETAKAKANERQAERALDALINPTREDEPAFVGLTDAGLQRGGRPYQIVSLLRTVYPKSLRAVEIGERLNYDPVARKSLYINLPRAERNGLVVKVGRGKWRAAEMIVKPTPRVVICDQALKEEIPEPLPLGDPDWRAEIQQWDAAADEDLASLLSEVEDD